MYGTKVEGFGPAKEWLFTSALLPVHSEESRCFDDPIFYEAMRSPANIGIFPH